MSGRLVIRAAVAVAGGLLVMYARLARKEEKAVRAEFDDTYQNYMSTTPGFIPKLKLKSSGDVA